jgi:hypothetical protein
MNIGELLKYIGIGRHFWIRPKSTGNECKNRQMGLHKSQKLLHCKLNLPQSAETTNRMAENACQLFKWQGVYI